LELPQVLCINPSASCFCFCCCARNPIAMAKAWSLFFKVCVSLYSSYIKQAFPQSPGVNYLQMIVQSGIKTPRAV
jgi:hypothetical protein